LKLYVPGRLFIRQGALDTVKNRKLRKGDKLGSRLQYFMFNDILVQTKPSHGVIRSLTYQYKKTIPFSKFTLRVEGDPLRKSKVEHTFTLVRDEDPLQMGGKKKKQQETYRFSCATEEEKLSWIRDLEEAISVNKLMTSVAVDTFTRGGTVRKRSGDALVKKK